MDAITKDHIRTGAVRTFPLLGLAIMVGSGVLMALGRSAH